MGFLLVPGLCLASAGGGAGTELEHWVAPVLTRVTPTEVPADAASSIEVQAVRGERESFFVVLRSAGGVGEVLLRARPLKGSRGALPPESIRAWRAGFRENSEGFVADALVPLGAQVPEPKGFVLRERKGENVPLLIEIAVPRAARPGRYRSVLELLAAGGQVARVPVELNVLPAELPRLASLPTAFDFDGEPWTFAQLPAGADQRFLRQRSFVVAGLDSRVTLVRRAARPPAFQLEPGGGSIALDFAAFDREMAPLLDGLAELEGAQASALPLQVPRGLGGMNRYKYVLALKQHLRVRGWADRLVELDPAPGAQDAGQARVPRAAEGDWMACRLAATEGPSHLWWRIPARGAASVGPEATPVGVRSLGWLAYRAGASGLRAGETTTRALFYPDEAIGPDGRPVVVESVRLKLLRDGLEDYELLRQAEDAGRGKEAARWAQRLAQGPGELRGDAALFDQAKVALVRRDGAMR